MARLLCPPPPKRWSTGTIKLMAIIRRLLVPAPGAPCWRSKPAPIPTAPASAATPTAVRCGLIHPGDPEAAVADAVIACTPTHYTDVALSGACAVAAAVARAMTPDTTLEDIIDAAVWGADVGVRYGAPWMGASVARKIDFAVQLATDVKLTEQDRLRNLYDFIGSTLAVPDSVPCAFGILAMAEGNPVQAAIYAAALSGDADTVGAIACAVAGAWQSIDVFPFEIVQTLRQANPQYNFEETAEGLYEIALKLKREIPPPGMETLADILGPD